MTKISVEYYDGAYETVVDGVVVEEIPSPKYSHAVVFTQIFNDLVLTKLFTVEKEAWDFLDEITSDQKRYRDAVLREVYYN